MTATTPEAEVHYDPYDVDIDDDPYPTWRRLRDEAPLYRNEELDFFALSRWADVKPALADWKTYRSGRGTVLDIIRAGVEIPPGILLFEDPPIHDAHRALLSRVFTPRRMLDLEPLVRGYCVSALDALAGRDEFDIIGEFGIEIPLRTMGFLFGIPEADQIAYRRRTDDALVTDGTPTSFDQSSFNEVLAVLADYVEWRSLAITAVQERPDLELVGVWVHSEAKVWKDAGELANGVPNGITATNDIDALLALNPDCVIYAASGSERDAGAVPRLRTPSHRRHQRRHDLDRPRRPTRLRALAPCTPRSGGPSGQTSIYASGIEPVYDDYGVEDIMFNALGFGRPLDFEPWIMLPGASAGEFHGQVRWSAAGHSAGHARGLSCQSVGWPGSYPAAANTWPGQHGVVRDSPPVQFRGQVVSWLISGLMIRCAQRAAGSARR